MNIIDMQMQARYGGGQSNFLQLRRALELLHAITKEMSSVKMMFGMKVMSEV